MTPIKLMVRVRRALWIAGTLLVLFTVTGFFILPLVVKSQLQKRLSAELGRPVVLGSVRVNPYALSVTLNDLEVGERGGTGSFLGWKRLYVEFGALASLTGDWVLSEIALDGFRAAMHRFLQDYDAVISPVCANPAVPHGTSILDETFRGFSYTMTYNVTGWPAAVVRCGESPEGLPIGIQVAAHPWREDVALAVALRLEELFGGWKPPRSGD